MLYDDFLCQFTKLEMCMMTPVCESMRKDDAWLSRRQWKVTGHQGAWQRQVNAGGCRNYLGETRLIDGQFTQDDSPGAAPRRQWKVTGHQGAWQRQVNVQQHGNGTVRLRPRCGRCCPLVGESEYAAASYPCCPCRVT